MRLSILTLLSFIFISGQAQHKKGNLTYLDYLIENGNYKDAESLCDKMIKIFPDNGILYYKRGIIEHDLNNNEEAIAAYDKALTFIEEKDAELVYLNRGVAFGELGFIDHALSDFEKVLEINPNDKDAHYNIAVIHYHQREKEEAEHHFEKTLQIDNDHMHAHVLKSDFHIQHGEFEEAKIHIEKLLEMDSTHHWALFHGADLHFQQEDYDKALEYINRAIKHNGEFPQAHVLRAQIHLENGDKDKACHDIQMAKNLGFSLSRSNHKTFCD